LGREWAEGVGGTLGVGMKGLLEESKRGGEGEGKKEGRV